MTTFSSACSRTHQPRPPASTTPAAASAGSRSGVRRSDAAAAVRAVRTTSARSPSSAATASAHSRATVSRVPSTGRATAAYASSAARPRPRRTPAAEPSTSSTSARPAQQLRQDDAGVAARAHQRAVGHGPQRRRGVVGGGADGVVDGLHRQQQVGAGVAVGHRVDVEVVDLVARRGEVLPAGRAPAPHGGGVEHLQHAGPPLGDGDGHVSPTAHAIGPATLSLRRDALRLRVHTRRAARRHHP